MLKACLSISAVACKRSCGEMHVVENSTVHRVLDDSDDSLHATIPLSLNTSNDSYTCIRSHKYSLGPDGRTVVFTRWGSSAE